MNTVHLKNNRIIWLFIIVLISLGLVGGALAAMNNQNIAVAPPNNPQTNQNGGHQAQLLPPSPHQPDAKPVEAYHPAEAASDKVRVQAMQDSKPAALADPQQPQATLAETEAGEAQASLGASGGGINYIPEGILVDTYLGAIYGRVAPLAKITITRPSDGAYATAEAEDVGTFWTFLYDGSGAGRPTGIGAGDELQYDIDGSITTGVTGNIPEGYINIVDDIVTGIIPGDPGGTLITVTIGVNGVQSTAYGYLSAITDPGGYFNLTVPWDVGPENFAIVDYSVYGILQRTYLFPDESFLIVQQGSIVGYADWGNNVHAVVYVGDSTDIRWEGDAWANYPYGWFTFTGINWETGDLVEVQFPGGGSAQTHFEIATNFVFSYDNMVSGETTMPNTQVRVSFLEWYGSGYGYHETHTMTDVDGNFEAIFAEAGIRPDTKVDIAVMDASGSGILMQSGPPYVEAIRSPHQGLNCVWGRVDTPNTPLTLELYRGGEVYPRDPSRPISSDAGNLAAGYNTCYNVWYDINGDGNLEAMEFQAGDVLRLSTPTWAGEVTVQEFDWTADAEANQVNGEIVSAPLDGEIALRLTQPYNNAYFSPYTEYEARTSASGGLYSHAFDNFDVRAGTWLYTYYYDPYTGFANQLDAQNHFFRTIDDIAVWGQSYIANEAVTLRLLDPDTLEPIYVSSNDADPDPYNFYFDFADYGIQPPLQPGVIVEMEYSQSGTGDWRMTYQDASVQGDTNTSLITATGPDKMLGVWGGYDQLSFDYLAPAIDGQLVLDTTYFGYQLGWGDSIGLSFPNQVGNRQVATTLIGEIRRVEFWLSPNGMTSIWGVAEPSHMVTVETSQGDTLTGMADVRCDGCFGTDHNTMLAAGDIVTVTAGMGEYPLVIVIPEMTVNSDSALNTVSGELPGFEEREVQIYPDWEGMITTTTDLNGYFSASFADIQARGRGYIRLEDLTTPAVFHRPFYDLEPYLGVNYANDWIEGQYDAGYEVAITVTNDLGGVKAVAHGTTGDPGWNGDTGFATWSRITPWDGINPDIQVGDYVEVRLSNGHSREVRVGEIAGTLDIEADKVDGTLNVPWLTDPVWVDCGAWVENGPGMGAGWVDPNGGAFTCDFASMGFDLLAGMDVGVSYWDPEDQQVLYAFQAPAPHLWLNMEQFGQPAFDNNYALRIHYNNDGRATAGGVSIVQQLFGMTYLSDTSGVTPAIEGNTLTWELGDLPVNYFSDRSFDVFVHVDDPTSVAAIVDINSSMAYYQADPWSTHYVLVMDVLENETDLNIGTWLWTGNPAPGTEFVYVVNVCNNSSTASTEVIVTDTLPVSTTFTGEWWANDPGWELVASETNLVFNRETVSGWRCSEVDFKVHLSSDAWPGMGLMNEVWVWSSSDLTPDNNYNASWNGVGAAYYNLNLGGNWVQGQFVPNGYIEAQIGVGSSGNVPMPGTLVTTTIPAGTEFLYGYTWDYAGGRPFDPAIVTDDYVVWDLGDFANGYWTNIGYRLKIATDAEPGMPLVIENSAAGDAIEVRYDDNTLVYTEAVHENGANLRVNKDFWWWEMWDNSARRINYELRVLNIGTRYLEDPVITDSYPISTTFDGCWVNHGPFLGCEDDPVNHQVKYYLDYLNPSETASLRLNVLLSPEDAGVQGLEFVNQVDISDFEDIDPADNQDIVTSYTGEDIFIRKWLKSGELRAGETITYTVEFGNSISWPFNWDWSFGSHITDTLPAGTTFVKAIPYWDLATTWEPESINGQQVVWGWGPMWSNSTWTFDVVVQIDPDVGYGQDLLNLIEAYGDSPDEVDINPENNRFELLLATEPFRVMMPITIKNP